MDSQKYDAISPINEMILNITGIYMFFCFFLCVLLNSSLLLVFIRFKELLENPLNIFVASITICNLFGSIQFPFVIDSNFKHK